MNHEKIAEKLVAREVEAVPMGFIDVENMSRTQVVMAMMAGLDLNRRAKVVNETLLTFQEGSSNKFHYFALFHDVDGERWVAGNAYGRIGYNPTVVLIAEGPSQYAVDSAYRSKIRAKKMKGYQEQSVRSMR